jgi:hypothetical protein
MALNEKAMQSQLQRITGAFVSSAFGAAQRCGTKSSAAKDLDNKLCNDDRDEDGEGPSGFESKSERARLVAAEMALQFFARMAAAEAAVSAYADITGDDWKPYVAPMHPPPSRCPPSRRFNGPRGAEPHGSAFRWRWPTGRCEGIPRSSCAATSPKCSAREHEAAGAVAPATPPGTGAPGPDSWGLLDLCRLVTNGCAVCGGGQMSEKRGKIPQSVTQ